MQKQTSIVKIYRTKNRKLVIAYTALCVNKPRGVFIYLHSCLDKLTIIASRKPENHLFVSDTWHYDTHVNPTLCRPYKSVKKAVTKHKIRCVEPHIIACGIEHLRKKRVTKENREKELLKLIELISHSGFVVTDRLHGMIMSIISGTPCIALDNSSKKVSGVYEFIKDISTVKLIKETVCLPHTYTY